MTVDLKTLKAGDLIKLRNGETHTVTSVEKSHNDTRLNVCTETARIGCSINKAPEWHHSFTGYLGYVNNNCPFDGDIVEILPNGAITDIPKQPTDAINPAHYQQNGIQTIDAIEAWGLNYNLGNAIKYLSRAGKKEEDKLIEDLKKAIWYIEREIKMLEKK